MSRAIGQNVRQDQLHIHATAPYYVPDVDQSSRTRDGDHWWSVSMVSGNSYQMIQVLADYPMDVATSSHVDTEPRLLHLELGCKPWALVVDRAHVPASQQSINTKDLPQEVLILRERGSLARQLSRQMLEAAHITPSKILKIASRAPIREAVIWQMDISVFALHEASPRPDLFMRELQGTVPALPEHLYWLRERQDPHSIQPFLQMTESR